MVAGQASATIYHIIYSGTVTYADDQTGEFGSSAALLGMSFKAFVTYDDAKAGATHSGNAWTDTYSGTGAATPVTATVVINGVSRTIGSTYGHDWRFDNNLMPGCTINCNYAGFYQNATDEYAMDGLYTRNFFDAGGSSANGSISGLDHTALNFTNPPVHLGGGVGLFQKNEKTQAILHDALIEADIDSVTASVPEPGTWALMLGGFGFTGSALRRRRAARVAFA